MGKFLTASFHFYKNPIVGITGAIALIYIAIIFNGYGNNPRIMYIIGATIVCTLALYFIYYWIRQYDKTELNIEQRETLDENVEDEPDIYQKNLSECSRPTPDEIHEAIDDQPPLLQDEFAKNYIGLDVKWTGIYCSITDNKNGTVDIGIAPNSYIVFFTLSLKEYPIFKTLKDRSALIRITGTIDHFQVTQAMILKDVKIISVQPLDNPL